MDRNDFILAASFLHCRLSPEIGEPWAPVRWLHRRGFFFSKRKAAERRPLNVDPSYIYHSLQPSPRQQPRPSGSRNTNLSRGPQCQLSSWITTRASGG